MYLMNPNIFSNKKKGFTTIELLVVMALMLVVVSAAAGIFVYISRIQKRILANQRVQGNVRFAMETLVREIHGGEIDYGYYSSKSVDLYDDINSKVNAVDELALRDSSYQLVLYRYNDSADTLQVCRGSLCAEDSPVWVDILSDDVKVTNAEFYIVPAINPFQPCGTGGLACNDLPNEQPRVTVRLVALSIGDVSIAPTDIWLQTTVASRIYKR